MFLFGLFETRSDPASHALLRWDGVANRSVDGDIGMERFASLPLAVPAEISAAGLTTSDLTQ